MDVDVKTNSLATAVIELAQTCQHMSDADMDQPWAWGPHVEGVRFALIGTMHELRDLALDVAAARYQAGRPPSMAQHALAQYHAAYRDLEAVLLGVGDGQYGQEPASGEWPLRYVLGHMAGTERHFFALVHYGLMRQRDGKQRPSRLPDGETERLLGTTDDLQDIMENYGYPELWAAFTQLHNHALDEFAGISDAELQGPSLWWEGAEYPLQHRLHRFEAHLRQHTVQAEQTLAAIGHTPNEARRLLRLVFNALAEVEGLLIGAPDLLMADRQALAAVIQARTAAVVEVTAQARALAMAVSDGDLAQVKQILQQQPTLVNARDQKRLPVILTAAYHQQTDIVSLLMTTGAELSIFEAAAVGRLDVVEQEAAADPEDINGYGRDGFTPLQLACYFAFPHIALWLIENGADVNAVSKNVQQITALNAAAAGNDALIVGALLEAGADANAQQTGGFTALHAAAQNGNLEMVNLLLARGADTAVQTANGQTAWELANKADHLSIADLLRT